LSAAKARRIAAGAATSAMREIATSATNIPGFVETNAAACRDAAETAYIVTYMTMCANVTRKRGCDVEAHSVPAYRRRLSSKSLV
jgi:hypothetical protein